MDTKVTTANQPEVLFFGCKAPPHSAGHFLYSKRTSSYRLTTPWGNHLDGGLLRPKGADGKPDYLANPDTTPRNTVLMDQKDGWTAVSFWDRSGDRRGASNSAFVVHAIMEVPELLRLAREQWPEIFARPDFPLSPHNGRRIHLLPVDDGYFDNTDAVLHDAQISCWCKPTRDAEQPDLIIHNARDGREAGETRDMGHVACPNQKPDRPISPGWMQVGETY